jgi:DNA-binding NarL/FixJ family response regulator
MSAALRELRDPWGLGLVAATVVVNLALRVSPLKAVAAATLVLMVKVAAGIVWPTPAPSAPSGAAATLDKLSPRELEVAVLIPAGLSNKEIARKLVPPTSERTVDNHVQHILNKLNFDSRAQIAAWVERQGLLKK